MEGVPSLTTLRGRRAEASGGIRADRAAHGCAAQSQDAVSSVRILSWPRADNAFAMTLVLSCGLSAERRKELCKSLKLLSSSYMEPRHPAASH